MLNLSYRRVQHTPNVHGEKLLWVALKLKFMKFSHYNISAITWYYIKLICYYHHNIYIPVLVCHGKMHEIASCWPSEKSPAESHLDSN